MESVGDTGPTRKQKIWRACVCVFVRTSYRHVNSCSSGRCDRSGVELCNSAGTSMFAVGRSDAYQLSDQPLTREIDSILGCFWTIPDDFGHTVGRKPNCDFEKLWRIVISSTYHRDRHSFAGCICQACAACSTFEAEIKSIPPGPTRGEDSSTATDESHSSIAFPSRRSYSSSATLRASGLRRRMRICRQTVLNLGSKSEHYDGHRWMIPPTGRVLYPDSDWNIT